MRGAVGQPYTPMRRLFGFTFELMIRILGELPTGCMSSDDLSDHVLERSMPRSCRGFYETYLQGSTSDMLHDGLSSIDTTPVVITLVWGTSEFKFGRSRHGSTAKLSLDLAYRELLPLSPAGFQPVPRTFSLVRSCSLGSGRASAANSADQLLRISPAIINARLIMISAGKVRRAVASLVLAENRTCPAVP